MKLSTFIIAASAAIVFGQEVIFDEDSGTFRCPTASGIYCAGDSLDTDFIIRCTNFVGQPGRCSNNLVGQPPFGTNPARCYASATQDGVAACEKNCIVYGGSGNTGPNFSLPGCVPYDDTVVSSVTAGESSSIAASSSSVATTSASVSNPTLGTTISSASVSNPTLGTTISSEPASTTTSTSNPILTMTGPSYGPGPGPETTYSASNPTLTVIPPTYGPGPQPSYLPPGFYNTTVTFTSCSTTFTYAPPIEPTTATREEDTTVYIPMPVPTTITFEDTTYTYGPEKPVPTTDSPPTLTATEPGTTVLTSTRLCITTAGVLLGSCGRVETTLTLPLPTTTFVGPDYTGGPTGGGGGSSGNRTYTVPTPSQSGGPSNTPVRPSATTSAIPSYTGAAASNAPGLGFAIFGLAAAFAL